MKKQTECLPISSPPPFLRGKIIHQIYDGITDDLLTGGLGHQGIQCKQSPSFVDPIAPTAQELRRRAIYEAYGELIDRTTAGGFGVYFGPVTLGDEYLSTTDGKIAGDEFLSFAVSASGKNHRVVTLMVQIPKNFDWAAPCILAAASSGSRGIYGAVPIVGEWGLKHRCAVAYTDKGTGIGAHDLENNAVYLITGERVSAEAADDASSFTSLTSEQRTDFNRAWPHRYAFKHAHSELLPDQYWGDDVLGSIEFALYALNSLRPPWWQVSSQVNTLIIASGISNGGAASLLAAEKDTKGLIHAIVVAEPAIQPRYDRSFVIVQGNRKPLAEHSRSLLDYCSLQNIYQTCALLDPKVIAESPPKGINSGSRERCQALHDRGLLKSTAEEEQGAEAQRIINDYGILEEQNPLEPVHSLIPLALTVTYANSYGRFSVNDHLAGYSFAAVGPNGHPAPLAAPVAAQLFSLASGIPPTPEDNGVKVINNSAGVGLVDSESTPDRNLDGAIRLRRLVTGMPEGGPPLADEELEQHKRIREGSQAVRANGNLHHKPAIIVHGRSDAVIPPNHSSRAYYGLNHVVEGENSQLHYYEIKHTHHFDAFNSKFSGYAERWVPLHHYFIQALAIMYNHLKSNVPLPPSQVVDTVPRGIDATGRAPPIGPANLPPIAFEPDPERRITFGQGQLFIPE